MTQLMLGSAAAAPVALPDDQRAALDAYYTPRQTATALVRWLDRVVMGGRVPRRILEPSVGGGAWVLACREVWPTAHITGIDLNGDAPGLALVDKWVWGSFLDAKEYEYDLVLGNPPYEGDLTGWIDRSRAQAPIVGYLLRATFLGSVGRLAWWQEQPPSDVVIVAPRPKWEGPGARASTDTSDSVFDVWDRRSTTTRLHWLDTREAA